MNKTHKKILSFVLSASFLFACLPAANVFAAGKSSPSAAQSSYKVRYTNDFEKSGDFPIHSDPPAQIEPVGTNHALFFTQALTKDNRYELAATFPLPDGIRGDIYPDTSVDFDLILPGHSADFKGEIFGGFEMNVNGYWWVAGWNGPPASVKASAFKDLGNGYCSAHISAPFLGRGYVGPAYNISQLKVIVYGTYMESIPSDYSGIIGIDNVVFRC